MTLGISLVMSGMCALMLFGSTPAFDQHTSVVAGMDPGAIRLIGNDILLVLQPGACRSRRWSRLQGNRAAFICS